MSSEERLPPGQSRCCASKSRVGAKVERGPCLALPVAERRAHALPEGGSVSPDGLRMVGSP
jgi:hypothetical protein